MTKKYIKKVAVGMSGGVDSSLSAHLLKEQGYDVTGVYLECWRAPGCRTEEDRKDALKVALDLNIPFKVLDFKQTYKDKVVEYFFEEYKNGRTPNPDILCNKEIKFGLFYDWAMENGFDYIATGHYGSIVKTIDPPLEATRFPKRLPARRIGGNKQSVENMEGSGVQTNKLAIPKDKHKDQTYFLYRITEHQLDHALFPLSNFTKEEVRDEARKRNIHTSEKKDSVGICFIGDIDVRKFLKDRLGEKPGDVVDTQGNVIGSHKGIWFYTIGQRNGFTIDHKTIIKNDDGSTFTKHNIPPFYVISKNAKKNQLVVGFGTETLNDHFYLEDVHFINQKPKEKSQKLFVRIRHTGELLPSQLINKNNQWSIQLDQAVKGIAEGQSAVFYQQQGEDLVCLGGGVISLS